MLITFVLWVFRRNGRYSSSLSNIYLWFMSSIRRFYRKVYENFSILFSLLDHAEWEAIGIMKIRQKKLIYVLWWIIRDLSYISPEFLRMWYKYLCIPWNYNYIIIDLMSIGNDAFADSNNSRYIIIIRKLLNVRFRIIINRIDKERYYAHEICSTIYIS